MYKLSPNVYVCIFVGKEMYVMSLHILKTARSILMSICIAIQNEPRKVLELVLELQLILVVS